MFLDCSVSHYLCDIDIEINYTELRKHKINLHRNLDLG